MRISDWSSDVCSSDLKQRFGHDPTRRLAAIVIEYRLGVALRPGPDHGAVANPLHMRLRIGKRRPAVHRHADKGSPPGCGHRTAIEHGVGTTPARNDPLAAGTAGGEQAQTIATAQVPTRRKPLPELVAPLADLRASIEEG